MFQNKPNFDSQKQIFIFCSKNKKKKGKEKGEKFTESYEIKIIKRGLMEFLRILCTQKKTQILGPD